MREILKDVIQAFNDLLRKRKSLNELLAHLRPLSTFDHTVSSRSRSSTSIVLLTLTREDEAYAWSLSALLAHC